DDGCLPGCQFATCGDGIKRAFVEECDDGNRIDGDGCSSACVQCPEGPTAFSSPTNGHCYWRESRRLTFDEATAACQFKKANLVIFSSDLEWKEVTERLLVGADLSPGPPSVWIGLRDEERNGVRDFGWVSGDRVMSAHWAIHEPRQDLESPCAAQSQNGTWSAVSCDEPRAVVCERPRWSRAPNDTRAYRRFVDRRSWETAAIACEKEGGRLVTFNDLADQERVARQYSGPIWIGARMHTTGDFRWISGERMRYRDFGPGEPNMLATEQCLALDIDGRWYTRHCRDRYAFVCEVL
ncbi:MAG TPA: lectin-like protein, partial [Polyangia bacterium]